MTIEIKDIQQKRLYVTAMEYEKKYGKSILEILMDLIYGDDPSVAVECIKLYFQYILTSDLDAAWMDEEDEPAELIEIVKKSEDESSGSD